MKHRYDRAAMPTASDFVRRAARHIPAVVRQVDKQRRFGGLVPLPALRDHLADVFDHETFDLVLIEASDRRLISLKTANDPWETYGPLDRRDDGIWYHEPWRVTSYRSSGRFTEDQLLDMSTSLYYFVVAH